MQQDKIRLAIDGMSCQACANRIEKVLNRQQGISRADVNFAGEEAQIEFSSTNIKAEQIIALIERAGFKAQSINQPKQQHPSSFPWKLALLWLCALPFFVGMLGMMLQRPQWMLPPLWQCLIATFVQWGLAWHFYRGAFAALRGGVANMDVLIVLGTTTIWLYSTVMLFIAENPHEHMYFEGGVMVLAFVSLGKYLEQRAKHGSLDSIQLMLQLTPKQADVQRDGKWQTLAYEEIKQGDVIRARQGDRIAADGMILEGDAWLNESHLTGESKLLDKHTGDEVLAGSLLEEGSIVFRADALGKTSLLGDMMQALSEAQGSKAPIARMADRVSAVFVPIVVGIALLTFLLTWWHGHVLSTALMHAVAVLVIACPCALGLATPAAIMVGMGLAARHGVWFKNAAALEAAARIDSIVMDKTGTLTLGKPHIYAYRSLDTDQFDDDHFLKLAASIESHSKHPLARAVVDKALAKDLELLDIDQLQNTPGQGISALIEHVGEIRLGTARFCNIPSSLSDKTVREYPDCSLIYASTAEHPIGLIALRDTLRPDSGAGLDKMHQRNIKTYIMSGDNPQTCAHIAQHLKLAPEQVYADMQPRDKAEAVQKLQQQGNKVAMVGDGVNDAPALATADVSFAMYDGSDIAEHSADAVLMRHSINQVNDALYIADATLRNIKQNLFFAFFYNAIGIPLAALGYLSPMLAGAAMAMSSISVLGNAMRLKRFRPPQTIHQEKNKEVTD